MLQVILIGHLGADAEYKNENGKEFSAFRVANTDRWTDAEGVSHENTVWVDCIIQGRPKVLEYLKKGQLVYVAGRVSLRVYSSAKDRCMKAGLTISVKNVELLGGRSDDVPSRLYSGDGCIEVEVHKFFYAPQMVRGEEEAELLELVSKSGGKFVANRKGYIRRVVNEGKE